MVTFTLSTITLRLAALASALPTSTDSKPKPLSPNEFTSLQAEGYPLLSLNMRQAASLGNFDLVFERPSAYPGTPAYLNTTRLDFDLTTIPSLARGLPGPYTAQLQEVGDNYGTKVPVTASFDPDNVRGRTGFEFGDDGSLSARITAALQGFFACTATYNGGEELLGLFWGVYQSNGQAPEGCVPAKLVKSDITQ